MAAASALALDSFTWNYYDFPQNNTPLTAYTWREAQHWIVNGEKGVYPEVYPEGVGKKMVFQNITQPLFVTVGATAVGAESLQVAAINYVLGDVVMVSNGAEGTGSRMPVWSTSLGYYCGTLTITVQQYMAYLGGGNYLGPVVIASGANYATTAPIGAPNKFRGDLWAAEAGGACVNPYQNPANAEFAQGSMSWYAPRSAPAQIGEYSLTEGSVYALRTGAAHLLSAGTTITGEGIAEGTYLKRVFEGTNWIELSAPATATGAATLNFAAQTACSLTQTLPNQNRGDATIRYAAIKYNAADTCEVTIPALSDAGKAHNRWGYDSSMPAGLLPGRIVINSFAAQETAQKTNFIENVMLQVKAFTGTQGAWSVTANCAGALEVDEGTTISLDKMVNVAGTLAKTGAGTLNVNVATAENAGGLAAREGVLAVTSGSAEELKFETLELASGAVLQLPVEGIRVTQLTSAAGAILRGPGKLTVVGKVIGELPQLEAGAQMDVTLPSLTEEAVLDGITPWMHLDATQTETLETYEKDGTTYVSKWFNTTGNNEYAAKWSQNKGNLYDNKNSMAADTYITMYAGRPYVDMGELTGTNNVKGKLDGPDRSLAFYGADGMLYAQGGSDTYMANTKPVPMAIRSALFAVNSSGGGGSLLSAAIDGFYNNGIGHSSRKGDHIFSEDIPGAYFLERSNNNCLLPIGLDTDWASFRLNCEDIYPSQTPFTGGNDLVTMNFSDNYGRRSAGMGFCGAGNEFFEAAANGLAFGEVILITNIINDAQFKQIEAYLARKWQGRHMDGYYAGTSELKLGGGTLTMSAGNDVVAANVTSGGTIAGDLVMTGNTVTASVSEGAVQALSVNGSASLPNAVNVVLNAKPQAGTYTLLSATQLNIPEPFAWTCTAYNGVTLSVYREGNAILLRVAPAGTIITLR